jgi:hypothetical protein
MELLLIPIVGLGGLYLISRDEKRKKQLLNHSLEEGFHHTQTLPNVNLPNKNYPEDNTIQPTVNDLTDKLSTVHSYHGGPAYTDKYFTSPSTTMSSHVSVPSSESGLTYPTTYGKTTQELETSYQSLTGNTVPMNYFQHNNMQPYFGSKSHEIGNYHNTESYLDTATGQGSTYREKKEQCPLFHPNNHTQHPNGFPNVSEFVQSRINPSLRHANVQPFEKQQELPGGQDLLMARDSYGEKTVDELRPLNKQKSPGFSYGYEGPAKSKVTNRGIMGIQEKHRVERAFETGHERWMTTTGEQKGATLRPIEVLHEGNRPETSQSYTGNANHPISAEYVPGEYMETHRQELYPVNMGPAYIPHQQHSYENDYGSKSHQIMSNHRTTGNHYGESYFGAVKSALGSVLTPLMDTLRPSRKEYVVGNLRPYQNAKSKVEGTYLYDPKEKLPTTMRELTQDSPYHWNVNGIQTSNAYQTTPHQVADTYRSKTDPQSSYIGNASSTHAKEVRPYDSAYAYQSNDVRASTIEHAGRMQSGNINLFHGNINMHSNATQEQMLYNQRAVDGKRYTEVPSTQTMGIVQGHETSLYTGQQLDRNDGSVLQQLQTNPYAKNVLHGL